MTEDRAAASSELALARLTQAGLDASGRDVLVESPPFDLCVVDEAHEMFAGIYKRFDQDGIYQEESPHARTAGRLREVLRSTTPVILLTATPIQNTLTELWGLVQFVDPTSTLLGDLHQSHSELRIGQTDRDGRRFLVQGQQFRVTRRLQCRHDGFLRGLHWRPLGP